MRLIEADAIKEALRNRISESIDECIDNVPTVDVLADGDRAISLNAIRDVFQKLEYEHKEYAPDSVYMQALWDVANGIRLLPPITPQPKTGHWEKINESVGIYKYRCDQCGNHHRAMYDYCPSCGAKMD